MAEFSCAVNPNSAAAEVNTQMSRLREYTDVAFERSIDIATTLSQYSAPHGYVTPGEVSFNDFPIVDLLTNVPDLDDVNIVIPQPPPAPTLNFPDPLGDPGPLPDRPADAPPPIFGAAPSVYQPVFGDAPVIVYPDVPEYGDYTGDIPEPNLQAITLPEVPDIDLDSVVFDSVLPTFTATAPDPRDFNYAESDYMPYIIDEVKETTLAMLNGQSGIPAAIEQALWERESEREAEQELRAEQESFYTTAQRGFSRPQGVTNELILRAQQNNQNQRNQKSRDIAIRVQEVLISQLDKAVTAGIALEDIWMRLFNAVQDRRLQAARVAIDIAINVFNAEVSLFNARMQGYQIEAQVYRERVQALISKVQIYAEQIRAQSLVAQLNQQEVEVYTARLRAVEVNVRAYLGFIEAYTAQLNGERVKLDVYRTSLEAENTKLQASSLQSQIFGQLIQAESVKQQTYVSRTQAYVANVTAWSTQYQALIAGYNAELGYAETQVKAYDSTVRALEARLGVIRTEIDAVSSRNAARVQAFAALTGAAGTTNEAQARRALAKTENARANADIYIKSSEINVGNAQRASTITLEAITAASRVLSQLASGAMSAGNVSASIGDTTSATGSCSYITSQSFTNN